MPPETTIIKPTGTLWKVIGPGHYRRVKNVKVGIDYGILTDFSVSSITNFCLTTVPQQEKE